MDTGQDRMVLKLLLTSSAAAFALFALAAYRENYGTDWYRYQAEYKRALIESAGTPAAQLAAQRFELGLKQLYVPELGAVDRCVSCHVSIDDPGMAQAPQPLTTHPAGIMGAHPKEDFGCVVCHGGQGRATTADDAHGHVAHWLDPMLAPQELDRACGRCHLDRQLEGGGRYNESMELFHEKGCLFCHRVRGQGGSVGPEITLAGELHDEEWHFAHFKDPKSVVETSEMPNMNLTDEEAEALTFLMMSYRGPAVPAHLLSSPESGPQPDSIDLDDVDPLAAKNYVGSKVCLGCHENLTPAAVDGWRKSKMTSTFERIADEPLKDNCLECHTTGYNPATGHYSDEGVGCEACHGPGREPVELVLAGRVDQHKAAIGIDPEEDKLVCARCHDPHVPVGTHADTYRRLPPRFTHDDSR